jgi:hypothetical protein
MDREQQIEFKSFTCKIIDNKIRYVLKLIIDGEDIQVNIQEKITDDYECIFDEQYYEKILNGMIKERYR